MSRFADPKATARLSLGQCQCPGIPHDEDYIDLRTEIGASEYKRLEEGDSIDLLAALAVGWNLLEADGTTAPVDREHIDRLYVDTFGLLNDWTAKHIRLTTLPNGPAVRSRSSTRANGSKRPIPTTVR